MKHLAFAAALLATPVLATDAQPAISPKDAREILSLIQGTVVKVSDLPEVYRLESELSAIANPPPKSPVSPARTKK